MTLITIIISLIKIYKNLNQKNKIKINFFFIFLLNKIIFSDLNIIFPTTLCMMRIQDLCNSESESESEEKKEEENENEVQVLVGSFDKTLVFLSENEKRETVDLSSFKLLRDKFSFMKEYYKTNSINNKLFNIELFLDQIKNNEDDSFIKKQNSTLLSIFLCEYRKHLHMYKLIGLLNENFFTMPHNLDFNFSTFKFSSVEQKINILESGFFYNAPVFKSIDTISNDLNIINLYLFFIYKKFFTYKIFFKDRFEVDMFHKKIRNFNNDGILNLIAYNKEEIVRYLKINSEKENEISVLTEYTQLAKNAETLSDFLKFLMKPF